MTAIEVGLLTRGSSYSPTPSQPCRGQWPALLVFVPAYSGASVRDLHPLPVSSTSRAITFTHLQQHPAWPCADRAVDVSREAQAVAHVFREGLGASQAASPAPNPLVCASCVPWTV